MARLKWDDSYQFEHGVDKGALYLMNDDGSYSNGVAWNGLVTVSEKASGSELNKKFGSNDTYLSLFSKEKFNATIQAYTYPDAFLECDGSVCVNPGVHIKQQKRRSFGMVYRTLIGDTDNENLGYNLHLVYGAKASPSPVDRTTNTESKDIVLFSWDITTSSRRIPRYFPAVCASHLVINSLRADKGTLFALEHKLFGTILTPAYLPPIEDVLDMFIQSIDRMYDEVTGLPYGVGISKGQMYIEQK